jgi:type I restriction enzyme S subunit
MRNTLPKGWTIAHIGDGHFTDLIMGQSPPGETYNKNGKGLPFFQGNADFGELHPTATVWCTQPKKIAQPNDVLLTVRAPVGSINIADQKCCIGRGVAAIRCKDNLTYQYLYWALRLFEVEISKKGSGSIFNAIGKDDIKKITFPVPLSTSEQLQIAEIIKSEMSLVKKIDTAVSNQEDAVNALQDSILREVFPYQEGDKLPVGWQETKLIKLGHLSQGGTPSKDNKEYWGGNILFVTGADVNGMYINKCRSFLTEKGLLSGKTEVANKGDILIVSRTGVGKFGIAGIMMGVSQDVSVLKTDKGILPEYLLYLLMSKAAVFIEAAQGATIKGITRDFIENVIVHYPKDVTIQASIVEFVKSRMEGVNNLVKNSKIQREAVEALPAAVLRQTFAFK